MSLVLTGVWWTHCPYISIFLFLSLFYPISLLCLSANLNPVTFCVCVCVLSPLPLPSSSSSAGPWAPALPCGACNDFRLLKRAVKPRRRERKHWGKQKKKKLDEDKREMTIEGENRHMIYREGKWEIDRANCELHQHYANRISVERWCDGDVIWGNLTLPVYFLLQDKRGTTHTHPQTRTFLFTFHSLSHTLYLQLHLHDRFCIECTP